MVSDAPTGRKKRFRPRHWQAEIGRRFPTLWKRLEPWIGGDYLVDFVNAKVCCATQAALRQTIKLRNRPGPKLRSQKFAEDQTGLISAQQAG